MTFEEDFRSELADISGAPGSSGDRLLEMDDATTDLFVQLETAQQKARADELEGRLP